MKPNALALEGRCLMSAYGAAFDALAKQWAAIENAHDEVHPDRNECGGVGGCSMMHTAVRLEQEMVDALEQWRTNVRPGAKR